MEKPDEQTIKEIEDYATDIYKRIVDAIDQAKIFKQAIAYIDEAVYFQKEFLANFEIRPGIIISNTTSYTIRICIGNVDSTKIAGAKIISIINEKVPVRVFTEIKHLTVNESFHVVEIIYGVSAE